MTAQGLQCGEPPAMLARRTAAERGARAAQLYADAVVLRGRLRTQTVLLRGLLSQRPALASAVAPSLDRVDAALSRHDGRSANPWRLRIHLPRAQTCGALARRLVEDYLHEHFDRAFAVDALTVISELSNNAFVHGSGAITFRVERLPDRLRVEVRDEGRPAAPIGPRPASAGATGGRGLVLVDRLSMDWGTTPGRGHVWAELAVPPSPALA